MGNSLIKYLVFSVFSASSGFDDDMGSYLPAFIMDLTDFRSLWFCQERLISICELVMWVGVASLFRHGSESVILWEWLTGMGLLVELEEWRRAGWKQVVHDLFH